MEILTGRLRLRDVTLDDVAAVHHYESHPRFMEHYPWDERNVEEARDFVEICMAWANEKPRIKFQLGITLLETGGLIGNCGMRKDEVDSREAELGYALAVEHWGKGLATEAAGRMVKFAFDDLNVEKVTAVCVQRNKPSIRVLERLKFTLTNSLPEGPGKRGHIYPERFRFELQCYDWQA